MSNNTISAAYLKDPANPRWDNDAGMKLYKQVMAKYYPSGNVKDGLNLYGVAAAHAFVQLMYKAGKNPTRASLMKAYRTWTRRTPFLLPGNRHPDGRRRSAADRLRAALRFNNGMFQPVSSLTCRSAT